MTDFKLLLINYESEIDIFNEDIINFELNIKTQSKSELEKLKNKYTQLINLSNELNKQLNQIEDNETRLNYINLKLEDDEIVNSLNEKLNSYKHQLTTRN
jgi:hypothetical protein